MGIFKKATELLQARQGFEQWKKFDDEHKAKTKVDFIKYAKVIDEDGQTHDVPENGVIGKDDNTHCFVCDSDYYHLWLGCYFLKQESENYKKPIYFKKIKDLKTINTCDRCFDYVTNDDYEEHNFIE